MLSTIKQNVRFYAKVLKKSFTNLYLFKLNKQYHRLDDREHDIWVRIYYKGFSFWKEEDDPIFFSDFEELDLVSKKLEHVKQEINRIKIKQAVL